MTDPGGIGSALDSTSPGDMDSSLKPTALEVQDTKGQDLAESEENELKADKSNTDPADASATPGMLSSDVVSGKGLYGELGSPEVSLVLLTKCQDDISPSLVKANRKCDRDEALSWLEQLSTLVSSIGANKNDDTAAEVDVPETSTAKEDKEATAEPSDAYMLRTNPEVRYCDWHEFKNRYPDEDGCCAIEVLMSSRDLDAEIELEQVERKAKDKQRSKPRSMGAETIQPAPGDVGEQRFERVRINSAFILAYLAKITGQRSWNRKPHTFLSPFKIFIHYHKKMEDEFRLLQQKFATQNEELSSDVPNNSLDIGPPSAQKGSEGLAHKDLDMSRRNIDATAAHYDTVVNTATGTLKAYQDMACYMNFMEKWLLPICTMFDQADYRNPVKVRYSDLWYLFGQEQLLFGRKFHSPDASDLTSKSNSDKSGAESQGSSSADIQLWRNYFLRKEGEDWTVDDLAEKPTGKLQRERVPDPDRDIYTVLHTYYIDFDGDSFAPVLRSRKVYWYEGEKDVTSLPVYPIRFLKNYEQTLQRLKTRGENFRSLVSQSHPTMSYLGRTLTHDPSENPIKNALDQRANFPEHVDSDVVVDFREAFQTYPPWEPDFFTIHDNVQKPISTNDEFVTILWADRGRSKQTGKVYESVVHPDGIESLRLTELAQSGGFLLTTRGPIEYDDLSSARYCRQDLQPEDLALLPSRVFVYSLRDRKFINADIRYLQPIKREKATFDKLKIPATHKTMIQSVVYEHLERKQAQQKGRSKDLEISDQDFIRGKGRGLVMLLHGAPGVGKTATAEAVADVYKKPLFPITCGDLGIEPKEVEANLSEIFRLASVWDCILLLDEAEIFLSPRAKKDDNLQRNALVSIFLRILEYYPGILFLTTNRPGALDEAVKSRVHITLLYPQLSKEDTISLFQMNIDRLKMIEKERVAITNEPEMVIEEGGIIDFATQHFEDFSLPGKADCRWNGRQIRNAFQIASSMARYAYFVDNNNGAGDKSRLYLGGRHFKMVETTTVAYDHFRQKTLGATDSEIARHNEERATDSIRRAGPQQVSSESRRRMGSPTVPRHSHPTPTARSSRNRGGGLAGPRGGGSGRPSPGYNAGFTTPRQQISSASPASNDFYESENVNLNWGHDVEEGDHDVGHDIDVPDYDDDQTYT